MNERLAIVVPCYNEEEVLPQSIPVLCSLIKELAAKGKISENSFVLFVNDGSHDRTWEILKEAHEKDPSVWAQKLSRNCGHQSALLSGLMTAREHADVSISIDADLQDDTTVIEQMIDQYHEGCEIVYGIRSGRKKDSFFKRVTAQGFYRLLAGMGVKTVYNHADFRLMSARALDGLSQFKERNLFLRGIVPTIGYKSECVYYERKERLAGESKYPVSKMMSFAFDGITSFSIKPMSFITGMGIFVILCAIAFAIFTFYSYMTGNVVRGWASTVLSIWFIGGLVIFSTGMVGQYVGKIYLEVKERPRYIIETRIKD
jgi:glycosyltransferase involved in cell wall biosynthesis